MGRVRKTLEITPTRMRARARRWQGAGTPADQGFSAKRRFIATRGDLE